MLTKLTKLEYVRWDHKGELVVQFAEGGEAVPLRAGATAEQVLYSLRHLIIRIERRNSAETSGNGSVER